MLEILWLLLVAWLVPQPATAERGIAPDLEPALVYDVFVPLAVAEAELTGSGGSRPLYGYATPYHRIYEAAPFYNWGAFDEFCAYDTYWPMVIRKTGQPPGDVCDDGQRTLLINNEPELGHLSESPQEAVETVAHWRGVWRGPIVCCGNYYDRVMGAQYSGLGWFREFVMEWERLYGWPPPLDAIHIHVYEFRTLNQPVLAEWKALADAYGWPIYVTESATFPSETYAPNEVAARLPGFLAEVESILEPDVLMWFSDHIEPGALGPNAAAWERFNLYTADGELTVVGEAWERWIYRW